MHPIFAQTAAPASTVSQKPAYPLTIPHVGTCDSWASCRRVCADPVNVKSCRTWAEGQGFAKPPPEDTKVIEAAKATLGCTTKEECTAFCKVEANRDKCSDFAQKNRLGGGYDRVARRINDQLKNGSLSPDQQEKVQEELKTLKCDGPAPSVSPAPGACGLAVACARSDNREVCAKIAEKVGLPGGEVVHEGPGGCRTRESCTAYCSDPANAQVCGRPVRGPSGATGVNGKPFDQRLRPAPRDRVGPSGATGIGGRAGELAPRGATGIKNGYEDGRYRPPGTMQSGPKPSPRVIVITATPPPPSQQSTNTAPPSQPSDFTGYVITDGPPPSPAPKPAGVLGASTQALPDLPQVPDENPWTDFWRRVFWQ